MGITKERSDGGKMLPADLTCEELVVGMRELRIV